jgi:hypothetical protein
MTQQTTARERLRTEQEQRQPMEYWAIWYPRAAATGLLLGRGFLDSTEALMFHAAPDIITVEVCDTEGSRVAYGQDLERTQETPMCRFRRVGDRIIREDFWPQESDLGRPVMLTGGEVGKLTAWWHSADRKEWRWQVEFYNSTHSPDRSTMASEG